MATSNLALIESVQDAIVKANVSDYLKGCVVQFDSGASKGDTVKVQVIAGEAGDFNATSNNYLNADGDVTGVDVVLNKHIKASFEIPQELSDRVKIDSVVKGAVESVLKSARAFIYAGFIAASFTNTAKVIGVSADFDYADFTAITGIADDVDTMSGKKTLAIAPAYATKLVSDAQVAAALSRAGLMVTGDETALALLGTQVAKTKAVPATGNVVGVYFDENAMAVAFGAPTLKGGVITPVADADTGFKLFVREVENVGTGATVVTVEAVIGRAPAIPENATLLKSAS